SVLSGRRVTRGPVSAKLLAERHPEPADLLKRVWPPMLATLVKPSAVKDDGYVLEVKYDGFRALAGCSSGRVALWSRNALDLSGRFPEVAHGLSRMAIAEAVIDGEVAALDAKGVPRFQELQAGRPALYFAFDLLWLDGRDLRGRPLEERREM